MITQASAACAVKPPSRPTIPRTLEPTLLAYSSARTRFGLTFFSRFPPPTENTNSASCVLRRLTFSHSTKTVSQPSSFVRAVNSDPLSVRPYHSTPPIFPKSFTPSHQLPPPPPP